VQGSSVVLIVLLSPSVQMCDIHPPTPPEKPSNHVPVDNEDCVSVTQSYIIYDRFLVGFEVGCYRWKKNGFVANFAQKVMKGQLSLSVRRLSGERVELFGRSEALVPSLNHHLFFPDHVHEFDPN
jgi:hypothetical protein